MQVAYIISIQYACIYIYMRVFISGGSPKWMVYIVENTIRMNDLGAPLFYETSI